MRVVTYSCADISHSSTFPLPELDLKGRGNRPPLPHIRRERTFNEPVGSRSLAGLLITARGKSTNANRIEHLPPVVPGRLPIEKTLENPVAVDHGLCKPLPCSLSLAQALLNDCRLVPDHMNSCRPSMMARICGWCFAISLFRQSSTWATSFFSVFRPSRVFTPNCVSSLSSKDAKPRCFVPGAMARIRIEGIVNINGC